MAVEDSLNPPSRAGKRTRCASRRTHGQCCWFISAIRPGLGGSVRGSRSPAHRPPSDRLTWLPSPFALATRTSDMIWGGAYAPPSLNTGMPSFFALSARLSWIPVPGQTTTPIGRASNIASFRLKGAALACFVLGPEDDLRHLAVIGPSGSDALGAFR